MGNAAKRRQVAARLKELGLGRLYAGNKKRAWRMLNAFTLDDLLGWMEFEIGDVFNDCDGLNHICKGYGHVRRKHRWFGDRRVLGWVAGIDHLEKGGGWLSCGCSPPERGWSREEVENYMKDWVFNPEYKSWTTGAYHIEIRRRFDVGEHICDDNGILYPEILELRFQQ